MAAAFRSAGSANESAASTTVAVTYTATAGDLLCCLVGLHNNSNAPTSVVSDLDGALTQVGYEFNSGTRCAGLYVLPNCSAGLHTITITHASSQVIIGGVAFGLSGVTTTSPTDGATSAEVASGGTTDFDISITSPSGDLALTAAVTASSSGIELVLDNGTVHVDTNSANIGYYVATRAGQGGATSIDGAFSIGHFGWTAIGANVNAAAGSTPGHGWHGYSQNQ